MKIERTGNHRISGRNAECTGNTVITISIELTRRNLTTLLAKLDDPASARTIAKHSDDGETLVYVRAVEDDDHYSDRAPGPMFMPSTGEVI